MMNPKDLEPEPEPARLTWTRTLSRLGEDRRRLKSFLGEAGGGQGHLLLFHPGFVCVCLHRLSHYCYRSGHRWMARIFWHMNCVCTGADISPPCDLGPGLVIPSPPATALMCHAGRNLTVLPNSGAGSELGRREDIGAGPGLPVLGDDVILEPHTGILGPVRIGHRVRIPAGVVVTQDVPDDGIVEAFRPRIIHRRDIS